MLCTHLELDQSVFAVPLHKKIAVEVVWVLLVRVLLEWPGPLTVDDAVGAGYFIG